MAFATAFIADGFKSSDKRTTCNKDFFTAISVVALSSNDDAISTPRTFAHSSKSASIAGAWAGAQEIKQVKITRPRITTCSISKMLTAKGERV